MHPFRVWLPKTAWTLDAEIFKPLSVNWPVTEQETVDAQLVQVRVAAFESTEAVYLKRFDIELRYTSLESASTTFDSTQGSLHLAAAKKTMFYVWSVQDKLSNKVSGHTFSNSANCNVSNNVSDHNLWYTTNCWTRQLRLWLLRQRVCWHLIFFQ